MNIKHILSTLFFFIFFGALLCGGLSGIATLLGAESSINNVATTPMQSILGGSIIGMIIFGAYAIHDLWKEYKKNKPVTAGNEGRKNKSEQNVGLLIKSLQNEKPIVRRDTAKALGEMQTLDAVKPLITALQDPEQIVRVAAAEALGKLHDSRAIESLITALQDREPLVRGAAADTLGKLHDPRAIEPLILAASDKDFSRHNVIIALGEIGVQLEDMTMRTRIATWLQSFADTENAVDTRRVAIKAAEKIGVPDNISDEVWFDVAVDRLVGIYRQHPQGFVAGQGGNHEKEIRRIGNSLNERGGMELMLAAHKEFARKCGVQGAPRNLEFLWDRIGQWRG